MRYEKAEKLLQLAMDMQAARTGLSLGDIQERYGVKRRTAQRMRDAILRIFPHADEVQSGERTKRWRIPSGVMDPLIAFSANELADLETAISLLKRENLDNKAVTLEVLSTKISALLKPEVARHIDPDLDALLEAEGLAMRPGPRPRIRAHVVKDLRQAIKACRKVVLHHRNRVTRRLGQRKVCPYGFLHGNRHYLVALNLRNNTNDYRLYSLPNIEKVELTNEPFERNPDFSLEEFARRSFGVFQEPTGSFDVAWRFLPTAAPDARDFLFHPEQTTEDQPDGSLIVRFHAAGALEMAWHLYKWGKEVEVLEPKHLARMCHKNRTDWPGLP